MANVYALYTYIIKLPPEERVVNGETRGLDAARGVVVRRRAARFRLHYSKPPRSHTAAPRRSPSERAVFVRTHSVYMHSINIKHVYITQSVYTYYYNI